MSSSALAISHDLGQVWRGKIPHICSAQALRTLVLTLSGPAALSWFNFTNYFFTWLLEIERLEGEADEVSVCADDGSDADEAVLLSVTKVQDDSVEMWQEGHFAIV